MLMENVIIDGGPGQGYRNLLSRGENSQLEDLKVSSYLKDSASKVIKATHLTDSIAQDCEIPRSTALRRERSQRTKPREQFPSG